MWIPKALARRLESRLGAAGGLGQTLAKAFVGSAGMKLAFVAIGFVNSMLLAKLLAPAGYGVYAYVMALVAFLGIPSQLGIPTLSTREVAVTNARKDWGHMKGLIRRAHQGIALLTLVMVLGALVALTIFGSQIEPQKLRTIALGLVLVPIVALGALRGGMLRGLRKVLLGQFPEQIVKPLVFLALILLLSTASATAFTPVTAMTAQIFASACAFAVGLYLFLKNRPPELAACRARVSNSRLDQEFHPFWPDCGTHADQRPDRHSRARPVPGERGSRYLPGRRADGDAGHLWPAGRQCDPGAAHRASLRAWRQGAAADTGDPKLARHPGADDPDRAGDGPVWRVHHPDGVWRGVRGAYVPLVILCVGQIVNASMGSVGSLLNMTGHERDTMQSILIGATVNVILNFILTPRWGMIGAATATATTLIVWNLIMWRKVYLRTGIESSALVRRRK